VVLLAASWRKTAAEVGGRARRNDSRDRVAHKNVYSGIQASFNNRPIEKLAIEFVQSHNGRIHGSDSDGVASFDRGTVPCSMAMDMVMRLRDCERSCTQERDS